LILAVGSPVFAHYPYAPGNYLPRGAELVAVIDDPDAAARAPVGDAIMADPAMTLLSLLESLPQTSRPRPVPHPRAAIPRPLDTLSAHQVFEIVGQLFPADGILVSESVNGAAAMWDRVKFRRPGSYLFCAAGGLGIAFPGAAALSGW